jgi:hypothetical protein
MESGVAEATREFTELINTHVSPEFMKSTDIRSVLLEYTDVFVPSSWEGIKGVEPLEFRWKDDVPERMKPPARHINPRIFELAEKEFRRLDLTARTVNNATSRFDLNSASHANSQPTKRPTMLAVAQQAYEAPSNTKTLVPAVTASSRKYACRAMLLNGRCEKPGCVFSHKAKDFKAEAR